MKTQTLEDLFLWALELPDKEEAILITESLLREYNSVAVKAEIVAMFLGEEQSLSYIHRKLAGFHIILSGLYKGDDMHSFSHREAAHIHIDQAEHYENNS